MAAKKLVFAQNALKSENRQCDAKRQNFSTLFKREGAEKRKETKLGEYFDKVPYLPRFSRILTTTTLYKKPGLKH